MNNTVTVNDIVLLFNSLTDDNSELATTEQIIFINKILRKISQERNWNFLRRISTGTLDSTGSIALPSNFVNIMNNYTEDTTSMMPTMPVVYVNANMVFPFIPQEMINQANYNPLNYALGYSFPYVKNYAYVDLANSKITVPNQSNLSVQFAYKSNITPVTALTSFIPLPTEFAEMVAYAMSIDDTMIQKVDALKNLLPQNQQMYGEYLSNLKIWDSRLINF